MFFAVVVLDLTLMTTTFGARIFRGAGKYHVGRGVAYTDDCEFPAFQVGGELHLEERSLSKIESRDPKVRKFKRSESKYIDYSGS